MDQASQRLPPLEWIRAFEAAARLGSFTAAAAETGLTQPAVSQRIAKLEAHLDAQLFLREARTIRLTVQGEAWLPHVQSALAGMQNSAEVLFARNRRHLTISASQSVIALWLMPRLAKAISSVDAAISVQSLVLGGQAATREDVIQIRYGSGDWPQTYKIPLFREVMAPVAAPDFAQDDWTRRPRIACSGPRPGWDAFADHFDLPRLPIPHLRVDTFVHSLSAASSGLGVALGSLPLCQSAIAAGEVTQLGKEVIENDQTYWLLASEAAITARQWDALSYVLCETRAGA